MRPAIGRPACNHGGGVMSDAAQPTRTIRRAFTTHSALDAADMRANWLAAGYRIVEDDTDSGGLTRVVLEIEVESPMGPLRKGGKHESGR
jgi:hypothetical protein